MATLQFDLSLTNLNVRSLPLAILLAFFLTVVTAGQAFSDGGHAGAPVSSGVVPLPVQCGSHSTLLSAIRKYDEELVAAGVASSRLAQLYANRETGTWTWVIRLSDTVSCHIASGDNWRSVSVPSGDPS